jgi:protein-arginine kinase activator protein McsA
MNRQTKGSAVNTPSKPKTFINAGAINKAFDVSDFTENANKKQCNSCNPTTAKPSDAIKLCANCQDETEQTATNFVEKVKANVGRFLKGVVAL